MTRKNFASDRSAFATAQMEAAAILNWQTRALSRPNALIAEDERERKNRA